MRLHQIADPIVKTNHGMVRVKPYRRFKDAIDNLKITLDARAADVTKVQPLLHQVSETGEAYIAAQSELENRVL